MRAALRDRHHMVEAHAHRVRPGHVRIDRLRADSTRPVIALEDLAILKPLGINALENGAPLRMIRLASLIPHRRLDPAVGPQRGLVMHVAQTLGAMRTVATWLRADAGLGIRERSPLTP